MTLTRPAVIKVKAFGKQASPMSSYESGTPVFEKELFGDKARTGSQAMLVY